MGVVLPGAGIRVVVEAQGRTGQLDRPEGGMVDLDQQALGTGLVPGIDLVQGAYPTGGDARVLEQLQPVVGRRPRSTVSNTAVTRSRC